MKSFVASYHIAQSKQLDYHTVVPPITLQYVEVRELEEGSLRVYDSSPNWWYHKMNNSFHLDFVTTVCSSGVWQVIESVVEV